MDSLPFTSYIIEERSFVAFIKREIHNLVKDGFSSMRVGQVDILVSELTSNIIKHAGKGELLYRYRKKEGDVCGRLELICMDNGPGIRDMAHMMKDGNSSTQTLGHGLGAIRRMCNYSQVYSSSRTGTVHYCVVSSNDTEEIAEDKDAKFSVGALSVNKPGEERCGDGYVISQTGTSLKIFLGDGLGHGPLAEEAVMAAARVLDKNVRNTGPSDLIRNMHVAARKTRGLVGTIVHVSWNDRKLIMCGVGNILSRLYTGIVAKNIMPYNGIIGLSLPTSMSNSELPVERYQTLIMCSDGIKTRWDITNYPGLLKFDPMLIAAVIYKDHARKTDDMTVLVAKVK